METHFAYLLNYNDNLSEMHNQMNAIQYMGVLMSKDKLDVSVAFELVEVVNRSYKNCQVVITILENIFQNEKSGRILVAVQVLEYLIKNCNRNFHQAANKLDFQKQFIGLLRRLRGKSNFLKDLRSNTQNWVLIQSKVLYLVQLWYDAFMLEENVYNNIVNTYKTLRKQNITFPPRSTNEKNLMFVHTQSPIFQNIDQIARSDHQKFNKKLQNMGLKELSQQMQHIQKSQVHHKSKRREIDIDKVSEKIAVIRSNDFEGAQIFRLIEQIKDDLQHGKVPKHEEKYWREIKEAAETVINQWEQKNAGFVQQQQKKYLENKMNKMTIKEPTQQTKIEPVQKEQQRQDKIQQHQKQINLLDL